jgi:hypothetical protein
MKRGFDKVYQFKITLEGIEPPIWRRIQVPETYSFWDLHVAIQDSMGWSDSHLHEFRLVNPGTGASEVIGIPGEDYRGGGRVKPGWEKRVSDFFPTEAAAEYLYDFGDRWRHALEFEGVFPRENGIRYPSCIDGRRACPPEDCGGTDGFHDLLETILVLGHEGRQEKMKWAGGGYDPVKFDPKEVRFDDPQKRWRRAFQ